MCITLNVKNFIDSVRRNKMKKLLVLALVLSMATMASASLTLTISGSTQVALNSVTTYTIGYSLGGASALVSSDVDAIVDIGSIGGGAAITANRDAGLDNFGINSSSGNYELAIINDVTATDMGSPLMSFQFTAPGVAGLAHIQLLDNGQIDDSWNQIMDAVMPTLNVQVGSSIPEPITMTLLGLGGLFLRRRSK